MLIKFLKIKMKFFDTSWLGRGAIRNQESMANDFRQMTGACEAPGPDWTTCIRSSRGRAEDTCEPCWQAETKKRKNFQNRFCLFLADFSFISQKLLRIQYLFVLQITIRLLFLLTSHFFVYCSCESNIITQCFELEEN